MGSTGSGRFTDYPRADRQQNSTNGGDGTGRPTADDRCTRSFGVVLEDVEHCDFFRDHGGVPAAGTTLRISHRKRITAETSSGEAVGNLPTSHNYLAGCLRDGYTYVGTVRESSNGPPVAIVSVDFAAVAPT
jgi:hypothetical protein